MLRALAHQIPALPATILAALCGALGSQSASLRPTATTNNCLGRRQFNGAWSGDPLFNGSLDACRVYRRALPQQEIADLFALR
jgi:hypothetical protein